MKTLSKNVEIKKQLTDVEKIELLKQISDADVVIGEKLEILGQLQIQSKSLKEQIENQHDIMSNLCASYRKGFTTRMVDCVVTYKDGEATFVDAKTGEIVEQRPISESEQLALSEHRIDAETIIREDSKEN